MSSQQFPQSSTYSTVVDRTPGHKITGVLRAVMDPLPVGRIINPPTPRAHVRRPHAHAHAHARPLTRQPTVEKSSLTMVRCNRVFRACHEHLEHRSGGRVESTFAVRPRTARARTAPSNPCVGNLTLRLDGTSRARPNRIRPDGPSTHRETPVEGPRCSSIRMFSPVSSSLISRLSLPRGDA